MVDTSNLPREIEFSTMFDIRGSNALFVKQIGKESLITIDGEASNPSFRGRSLPVERDLRGNHFSAFWESDKTTIELTQNVTGFVGTYFLVGVDQYQKVFRSL